MVVLTIGLVQVALLFRHVLSKLLFRLQVLWMHNVLVEHAFDLATLDPIYSSIISDHHWTHLCGPPISSINHELLTQFYYQFDPHSNEFMVKIIGTFVIVSIKSIMRVLLIPIFDTERGRISILKYNLVVRARILIGDNSISFSLLDIPCCYAPLYGS